MTTPLLTTKLYIPPPRPNLVPRPRLVEQMNEGLRLGRKLTLITAPAGFGKTTLLSEWAAGLERPVAWLSFDESDSDPRRAPTWFHASGLPVPAVSDIVRVNGRNGLIYQRVDGDTMWRELSRKPWGVLHHARRAAELHAEMHASAIRAELPSQRQKLVNKIGRAEALPARLRSKALAALETMPDGGRLCHGDFSPDNILVTTQGEIIIDWTDASWGNPLADLARTTILTLGAADCQNQGLRKAFVRMFHTVYIRRYFKLRPGRENEYNRWLPIVAAARLSEKIPEVERWLIARVEKD